MKELFRYIKENSFINENKEWIKSNNVLFVAICTFIITLGAYFVKFVIYVYMKGRLNYWNVPAKYIKFDDSSNITNLAFYAFVFFYIFALLRVVKKLTYFAIYNFKKDKILVSLGGLFGKVLMVCILGTVVFIIPVTFLLNPPTFYISFISSLSMAISSILYFFIYYWADDRKIKHDNSKKIMTEKKINDEHRVFSRFDIVAILVAFSVILMIIHWIGIYSASAQDIFDLTEEKTYTVMYSYEDNYLLLACEVDEKTNVIRIYTDTKVIKAKKDLVITTYQFDQVDIVGLSQQLIRYKE